MVAITTKGRCVLVGGLIGVIALGLTGHAHGALPPNTSPTHASPKANKNITRAVGIGRPPAHMKGAQARLMARRAAEVIAVRNLARKLGMRSKARLRGFRYVLTEYRADGTVKVVVEYPRRRASSYRRPKAP